MSESNLVRATRVLRDPRRLDRETMQRGVGKVSRVIRRMASRGFRTPSPLRDPDEPRLLFRPATGEWYVPYDGCWYTPQGEADLDQLLFRLPLEVIDERDLASEHRRGGEVRVVVDQGDALLEFVNPYGDRIRRAVNSLPGVPTVAIDRGVGFHDDGWVETIAVMGLDGARRCWIEAFLPDSADGDKHLAVAVTVGRRTTVDIHRLARGETTRVPVYSSRSPARSVRVRLETSAPEPVDEERSLGFVISAMEALA